MEIQDAVYTLGGETRTMYASKATNTVSKK